MKKFRIRYDIESPLAQTILYIVIITGILLVFIPVYITVSFSLKTNFENMTTLWSLPSQPQWGNWSASFFAVLPNMLNSVIIGLVLTFFVVLLGSIVAYIFVRKDFFGKKVLFSLIIAVLMIPNIITLTPLFLMVVKLNLRDSWFAIWLPNITGGQVAAFFLFHTFFRQQPRELFEAAKIDGASEPRIYLTITVPLAAPILIIQALGSFNGSYNDFLWPSLVISEEARKPLMPVLKNLAGTLSSLNKGMSYALYLMSGV